MINFINISNNIPYQDRPGDGFIKSGIQLATNNFPIDFQYESSESVTSFKAVKVNLNNEIIEEISLSTYLISSDGFYHVCDGNTAFDAELECGFYYFLVNDKYQSETFEVANFEELFPGINSVISVSGLYFFNTEKDLPEYEKEGKPFETFGREFGTNLQPLKFQYISDEAVNTFQLVEINLNNQIINTTNLDTSLIESSGGYHYCNGLGIYSDLVQSGIYYFLVNGKYRSKNFCIFELVCPVIENISIANAVESSTAVLSYDISLTGANESIEVTITYTLSSGLTNSSETFIISPLAQTKTVNISIPSGIYGSASIIFSNNLCINTKYFNFEIEQAPVTGNCLELYSGGVLEIYSGGCLETYS